MRVGYSRCEYGRSVPAVGFGMLKPMGSGEGIRRKSADSSNLLRGSCEIAGSTGKTVRRSDGGLRAVLAEVANLLFPQTCAGCGAWDEALCAACTQGFDNAFVDVSRWPPFLQAVTAGGNAEPRAPTYALGVYQGAVRAAIVRWKHATSKPLDSAMYHVFHGACASLRGVFGDARCSANAASLSTVSLGGEMAGEAINGRAVAHRVAADRAAARETPALPVSAGEASDSHVTAAGITAAEVIAAGATARVAVVPAASHNQRKRNGTYVTGVLARAASDALGVPMLDVLHKRRRSLRSIASRVWIHAVRTVAIRGGYAVDRRHERSAKLSSFECRANLHGVKVVLVDDVLASGATLMGCNRAIEKQGGEVIAHLCLAAAKPQSNQLMASQICSGGSHELGDK